MTEFAIIGGTGLTSLETLKITGREILISPYGEPSGPIVYGEIEGNEVAFLPRHGAGHNIPPHKINYRANLWALNEVGIKKIVAVNAVGGIRKDMRPGRIVIPDQIIDYTSGRIGTFFEEGLTHVTHIDFTYPYSKLLTSLLCNTMDVISLDYVKGGTYATTQGPRLETAAEVQRLKNDGCDLVGMTGMPEAALARELHIEYASICVVANWAAGLSDEEITMEAIEACLIEGMEKVRKIVTHLIPSI